MSHRMSVEARAVYTERRATDRERTIIRHAERHNKVARHLAFGGK